MEKKHSLSEMMQESMDKVRELVDSNTIVGEPIRTPDGVTLIPISRVNMGFGGGGGEFAAKSAGQDGGLGAGVAAGVRIDPVAFLIVKDGVVRMMPVAVPAVGPVERVVEMVPEVIDRVSSLLKKEKPEDPIAEEEI
ncbi:MAG: sporulation protein YtfJ [Oscillospiraceae bacterium]|nr:sporulation protein YtfJ [Oscillospiraceae bacterium]